MSPNDLLEQVRVRRELTMSTRIMAWQLRSEARELRLRSEAVRVECRLDPRFTTELAVHPRNRTLVLVRAAA